MRNAAASPRSSHGAGLGGGAAVSPSGWGGGDGRGGEVDGQTRGCASACVHVRGCACVYAHVRAQVRAITSIHAPRAHTRARARGRLLGAPASPRPPPPLQRGLTAPWGGGGSATSASSCLLPWKPSALRALEACGCGRGERGCCGRKGPRQGHGSVGTSRLRGDAVRPRGCDSSAGTSRLRGDVAVLLGLRQLTAPVSVPPAAPVGWG